MLAAAHVRSVRLLSCGHNKSGYYRSKRSFFVFVSHLDENFSEKFSAKERDILHSFWQARGVKDCDQRAKLIHHGYASDDQGILHHSKDPGYAWDSVPSLPGACALWQLESDPNNLFLIKAITARLLDLHTLLGNRADLDVASILINCPRLLSKSTADIVQRLIIMKGTKGAHGLDIGKIVEAQPSLLLSCSAGQDSPDAWRYGLVSAADGDWSEQIGALKDYQERHGHVHVGFDFSTDIELTKFAKMQRAAFKSGTLQPQRKQILEDLGFEFNTDEAEWSLMLHALQMAQKEACKNDALSDGGIDFLLNNWCSVQRVAKRSGMLCMDRIERLDALNFEWTGADALS